MTSEQAPTAGIEADLPKRLREHAHMIGALCNPKTGRNSSADLLIEAAAQIAALEEQVRSAGADAWQPIETLPNAERLIMAYCPPDEAFPDGRMMNWRASMLFDQFARIARGIPQPSHLSFPATHWREMPAPPSLNPPESSNAAS